MNNNESNYDDIRKDEKQKKQLWWYKKRWKTMKAILNWEVTNLGTWVNMLIVTTYATY